MFNNIKIYPYTNIEIHHNLGSIKSAKYISLFLFAYSIEHNKSN